MTIATILADRSGGIVTAPPDMPVQDVVALLAEHRIGAVPVTGPDGQVLGVMSERDVIRCLATHGPDSLAWPVDRAMTAEVITAEPAMPLLAALSLMTRRRIRHLPVLEGGRLTGFVSIGDLVKARIDRIEAESRAMRDYIQAG